MADATQELLALESTPARQHRWRRLGNVPGIMRSVAYGGRAGIARPSRRGAGIPSVLLRAGRHPRPQSNDAMRMPHVRLMGDTAVIVYQRLVQRVGADGTPVTSANVETRVWQRKESKWRHVHFHRTPLAS